MTDRWYGGARERPLERSSTSPFPPARRRPRPRIDWRLVLAVATGGFAGGLIRYAVTWAWPATSWFPWATWTVNTAGSFVLGLVLVLVLEAAPPTRYVRAVIGTGFCGALTTFSSVTGVVARMVGHAEIGPAAGYLAASVAAGLAAAALGIILGRALTTYLERRR